MESKRLPESDRYRFKQSFGSPVSRISTQYVLNKSPLVSQRDKGRNLFIFLLNELGPEKFAEFLQALLFSSVKQDNNSYLAGLGLRRNLNNIQSPFLCLP